MTTIKIHAPQKATVNDKTCDNLTDEERAAVWQFIDDWLRMFPKPTAL